MHRFSTILKETASVCLHIYPYIFGSLFWRPLIFQTMNSVRSRSLSLKYQKITPSGLHHLLSKIKKSILCHPQPPY